MFQKSFRAEPCCTVDLQGTADKIYGAVADPRPRLIVARSSCGSPSFKIRRIILP